MASVPEDEAPRGASCPSCGARLPDGAPEGLCRRCLVSSVLAVADGAPDPDEPALGTIGGYEIIERIAQGGMGAIYRARQPGLEREVAVKLIPEGKLAGTQDVERFRIEAAAASELDHPNILPIHEVGEEDGQHFYSMPLVGGGSLAARVREYSRNPRAAAELVRKVAEAVHHAHQRGILHRDIKPANILLNRHGEPLVSDFGLAKRLGGRDAMLTQTGQMLGSPAYIAPEIAAGRAGASVASEVYALGVVLYQLLVGEVPFSGTTQMEVLRHVVDRAPVKPSSVESGVPRDLETICLKCLEKDPGRRYGTAAALAEDIGRWVAGKPIEARPAGALERAVKWCRRQPAAAALIGVSVLGAASLIAVLAVSARRIGDERDAALEQRRVAREGAYVSDLAAAYGALERGNLASARSLVAQAGVAGGENLRDFAWRLAWWLCQGEERRGWKAHDGEIASMVFAPEGGQLVTGASGDERVRFWDVSDATLLRTYPDDLGHGLAFRAKREAYIGLGGLKHYEERVRGLPTHGGGSPRSLAFFPDSRFLAVGGGNTYARVLDLDRELPYGWLNMPHAQLAMVAGTDGMLAAGWDLDRGAEREAAFFDANDPSGHEPLRGLGFAASVVAAAPDGSVVAAANHAGLISYWRRGDRFSQATEKNLHRTVSGMAIAAGGARIAVTTLGESGVNLWHLHSGVVSYLAEHKAEARAIAFSPDGRFLATGSNDQTIGIWVAGTGKLVRLYRGHTAPVTTLAWHPDGGALLSGAANGEVKEWGFREGAILNRGESWHAGVRSFAISRDGSLVAGVDDGGLIKCWNIDGSGYRERQLEAGADGAARTSNDLCFYNGGASLAVLVDGVRRGRRFHDGRIDFLDAATLEPEREPLELGPGVFREVEVSPDSSRLVVGMSEPRGLRLFELPALREIEMPVEWEGDRHHMYGYAQFTPDGRKIVARDWGARTVEVHDAVDGRHLAQLPVGRGSGLAVSPDSRLIAAGVEDNTVALWDLERGEPLATFAGHLYASNVVWFSPDSTLLLSSAGSGTVRAWHVPTRREIGIVDLNSGVTKLLYSEAEGALVTKRIGSYIERWKIPTLEAIESAPTLFGGGRG